MREVITKSDQEAKLRLKEQAQRQEDVAKEFANFAEAMEAFGSKHGKI